MATTKNAGDSDSEDVPPKGIRGNKNIFDKYKTFLEEHLSREDHNTQEVATKWLTVKTTGTFDYVSVAWTIHMSALRKDYSDLKENQWSLYGIRRFGNFTKLDDFPDVVDGEVFVKTPQPQGIHNEYLKADTPANFAFFLVGKYSWWSSRRKILGPLTISLTPLRATTKEMWGEIAEILNMNLSTAPEDKSALKTTLDNLAQFEKEAEAIRARTDISAEEKEEKVDRIWTVYSKHGKDGG